MRKFILYFNFILENKSNLIYKNGYLYCINYKINKFLEYKNYPAINLLGMIANVILSIFIGIFSLKFL